MPAVSFQQVAKTYAGARGSFRALDQVTFDVPQGEFFGLLGPTPGFATRANPLMETWDRHHRALIESYYADMPKVHT